MQKTSNGEPHILGVVLDGLNMAQTSFISGHFSAPWVTSDEEAEERSFRGGVTTLLTRAVRNEQLEEDTSEDDEEVRNEPPRRTRTLK